MKKQWTDSNITILGLSKSGIAAAKYLSAQGANCVISEQRMPNSNDLESIKELKSLNIKVEMGNNNHDCIKNAELIVTSPGIPPHAEIMKFANSLNKPVISEIELAYRETSIPFVAITGTNGKTTTTKLVSEIFQNAGYNAPVCGNIGIPVCSLIEKSNIDFFITEMSSFQIHYSPTFKPQIALFLNYTPDHVDWHGSEQAYFDTKATLFTTPRSPSWIVLNASDTNVYNLKNNTKSEIIFFSREMANGTSVFVKENAVFYKKEKESEKIIDIKDIPLIGEHNYQNIMASIAIAKTAGIENAIIKETIMKFIPPEHRLEYVDIISGIKYYNDSKATNCDSAIWALKAFKDEKVVLIAGGRDKGTDLTDFVEEINKHATSVILIGEATNRFEEGIKKSGFSNIYKVASLEEAIDMAGDLKQGPVLFSPACSSYDMFKNYEERGKVFKDYVIKKKQAK